MVLANPEQPVQAQRIANAEILIDGNAVESNGSPIKSEANVFVLLETLQSSARAASRMRGTRTRE